MGKKKGELNPTPNEEKEGHNLLGSPTFEKLENGRFKCVETGHELPPHATDSYSQSKHCRLGLIDSALARKKPPLNMFKQDPVNRMKVICKLTGDTINKSEEHIWKHINGKRFLNMLEKKEAEKEMPNGTAVKQEEVKEEKKDKKVKKTKKKGLKEKKKKIKEDSENDDEITNDVNGSAENGNGLENEDDFWMPPPGERWDHDDGGDRWGSDSESGSESDGIDEEDAVAEEDKPEVVKLSKNKKRAPLENGPASKKKKKKTSDV